METLSFEEHEFHDLKKITASLEKLPLNIWNFRKIMKVVDDETKLPNPLLCKMHFYLSEDNTQIFMYSNFRRWFLVVVLIPALIWLLYLTIRHPSKDEWKRDINEIYIIFIKNPYFKLVIHSLDSQDLSNLEKYDPQNNGILFNKIMKYLKRTEFLI